MALARVDVPAVVLCSGPMRAGRRNGTPLTIQDVWEGVAAEERGLITRAELDELELHSCPGLGRLGDALIPATESESKNAAARAAGELVVSLARAGTTARRFLDRRAL